MRLQSTIRQSSPNTVGEFVPNTHPVNSWFLDGLQHSVATGRQTVVTAASRAVAAGNLLIGTVVTSDIYSPVELTTLTPQGLRRITAHNGVRASAVASTAILAAAFGDCNEQGQLYRLRPDSPLLDGVERDAPDRPVHGWRYDNDIRDYTLNVAKLWWARLSHMEANTTIGVIDIVYNDGSFTEFGARFPDSTEPPIEEPIYEPGHFYSYSSHKTLASLQVRVGDVLSLRNVECV